MKQWALASLMICTIAATPTTQSPYMGNQSRQIKSLDAAAIGALQRGEGHGMALAAELNHYPGPRHVLAMATHLNLSNEQKTQTELIYGRMHSAAIPLGKQIIAKERQLDREFKNGTVSDASLEKLTAQIAALNGRLRDVHLGAHLKVKRILTPEQIQMYDSMRGYDTGMPSM